MHILLFMILVNNLFVFSLFFWCKNQNPQILSVWKKWQILSIELIYIWKFGSSEISGVFASFPVSLWGLTRVRQISFFLSHSFFHFLRTKMLLCCSWHVSNFCILGHHLAHIVLTVIFSCDILNMNSLPNLPGLELTLSKGKHCKNMTYVHFDCTLSLYTLTVKNKKKWISFGISFMQLEWS